jgi:hypothetical protein
VPIVFTRPRRGEKLFEELLIGAACDPTKHPRILTATETALDWNRLSPLLDALHMACAADDEAAMRALLADAPIGYAPRRAGLPPTTPSERRSAGAKAPGAAQAEIAPPVVMARQGSAGS